MTQAIDMLNELIMAHSDNIRSLEQTVNNAPVNVNSQHPPHFPSSFTLTGA